MSSSVTDSNSGARKNLGWLAVIGATSFGCYALLALRYPVLPSLDFPRASWADLVTDGWPGKALHLVLSIGLTLLYLAALKLLNSPAGQALCQSVNQKALCRRSTILIIIVWLVSCLVLMSMAPAGESHDIFDYVFRGRMMAEYQANPLAETPKTYNTTAYYRYLAWHSHVDTYGPLWEMTSAGIARSVSLIDRISPFGQVLSPRCPGSAAGCRLLIGYLSAYRLLAIGLMGAVAALISGILRRSRPELVLAGLVAWLWNPLVLVVAAVGAHNDMLMVALLMLGLWLLQRRLPLLALLALILALHVKLTALIWLPVFILWIVRKWGWRRAAGIGAAAFFIGLAVSWLLYLPFDGWSTLPRMLHERGLFLANSPWQVLHEILYKQYGWPKDRVLTLTVDLPTLLGVAGSVLITLWIFNFRPKRWQRSPGSAEDEYFRLWAAATAVPLFYLLVGAFWYQHWYLVWVLAPAALLPYSAFTRSIMPWLCFGALLANFSSGAILPAFAENLSRPLVYSVTVAMIWFPALFAAGLTFFLHIPKR